jgi:L-rhamnose mutarotase
LKKYCLTLDLKDDTTLIAEYEAHHKNVWPEVLDSINGSGIIGMEIYRYDARLFMIMETLDDFSFENKAAMDEGNVKAQEWEQLMWKYQQPVKGAVAGAKWVLMDKIFQL